MVWLQAPLLELFNKYKDSKGKQAKLKDPGQLQELLDITRQLLADMETRKTAGVDRRASTTGTEEEKQQELVSMAELPWLCSCLHLKLVSISS